MEALKAVETVLRDEGGPLHYVEITKRILDRKLWNSDGKTPEATVNSRLAVEIQERGADSRFCRVSPGKFALRDLALAAAMGSGGLADGTATSSALAAPKPELRGKKMSVQEIRSAARQIVKEHSEGIRYGQLLATIFDSNPQTPRNTIQGAIWNLDSNFPGEIVKPARGLFKPLAAVPVVLPVERKPEVEQRPVERLKEDAFYEPFADWLRNDVGDATVAVPLGGAALKGKWGTPDVIGVYKAQAADRIKFAHEIISAEIKVEPNAPVVAFGQAVAYRLFSTKTYIAMPETIAKEDLDRLEALCMLFGVGLVLFSLDPEQPNFRIRMRAQRFSPDMYFVNEFADGLHRHDKELFNQLFQ